MKRNRIHIIFIALLQLLVFVTPNVIKVAHHHQPNKVQHTVPAKNTSVNITHEPCLICHFEFVNVIKSDTEEQCICRQLIYSVIERSATNIFYPSFNCFSNRAPPLLSV